MTTVAQSVTLEKVAQLVLRYKIAGLPLVEPGKPVGVTTNADILRAFLEFRNECGTDCARNDD
jgi:CBS domain-containing protein